MIKRKIKRFFGISLISLSLFLLLFNLTLTGAIVGIAVSNFFNLTAIITLIAGLVLFLGDSLERNLAEQTLRSGAVITDPRKIEKIARKMGYVEGREVKEGHQVLYKGKPLTVIPHHNISGGVYRSIMKALATGESSFRRYSHA